MMTDRPGLLLFYPYMEVMAGEMTQRFDLLRHWEKPDGDRAIAEKGGSVVAILTTGHDYPIDDLLFDRLPRLRIIVVFGSGYAGIDVAAARRRGITVANAGDTHSAESPTMPSRWPWRSFRTSSAETAMSATDIGPRKDFRRTAARCPQSASASSASAG